MNVLESFFLPSLVFLPSSGGSSPHFIILPFFVQFEEVSPC